MVSKFFDEEISRVVFDTPTFNFDGKWRPGDIGWKLTSRRLMAMIKKSNRFPPNGLVDSIRMQARNCLLEHATHEEFFEHAFSLCKSIAKRLDRSQTKLLFMYQDPRTSKEG